MTRAEIKRTKITFIRRLGFYISISRKVNCFFVSPRIYFKKFYIFKVSYQIFNPKDCLSCYHRSSVTSKKFLLLKVSTVAVSFKIIYMQFSFWIYLPYLKFLLLRYGTNQHQGSTTTTNIMACCCSYFVAPFLELIVHHTLPSAFTAASDAIN